jgi:hypothetical protein
MGTVRLEHVWAKPDTAFPYMVERIEFNPQAGNNVEFATLYLDIWSNQSNGTEALAIRTRIMELLDEKTFAPTGIVRVMIRRTQMDGFVPEVEESIFHYTTKFDMRFFKYT